MATKYLMSLSGGGAEVQLLSEDGSKLLQLHLSVEAPLEDEYPQHGTVSHTGWMHVDLADAKDLYDTLGLWLRQNRVI